MDDLEDVFEAIVDVEEIAEEIADPEDLLEDFAVDPRTVAAGLAVAVAGLFTLLMLVLSVVLFAFRFGLLPIVVALTVFGFLVTITAVAVFLYVRPNMSIEVQREVAEARERVDDRQSQDSSMTETEAIDALKDKYAEGQISEWQLEEGLEAIITGENPEEVVERYGGETSQDAVASYDREYS